jgi:hygromycin-B 4-O-kinase
MSKVKTRIETGKVEAFLKSIFSQEISNLSFIKGGELSQAFSFCAGDDDLVIRVNNDLLPYKKDAYCYMHFKTDHIPIPEITKTGELEGGYYYAISRKAKGKMLIDISSEAYREVFPELIAVLDMIHATDISGTSGYGKWEADGSFETKTWKEYVLAVKDYVIAKDNRPSLFETSFLEKELWEKLYAQIGTLLEYCPEERYLVHGDYGSDNVMTSDGKITGVLDWAGAKYGDFLFDAAWLNFWNPERNPMDFFEKHYKGKEQAQNFAERMKCYQLRIALSSLSFYAWSDQLEKYHKTVKRALEI